MTRAEDFARADLRDTRKVRVWVGEHGALDLRSTFPADSWEPHREPSPNDDLTFLDPVDQYPLQQATVDWHLLSLVRLSLLEDAWQPAWMTVGLQCQEPLLIDASDPGEVRYLMLPDTHASDGIPVIWVPYSQWWEGWSHTALGEGWRAGGLVPTSR